MTRRATLFTISGAAILAGVGIGLYPSIEEAARRTVKWDKTYEPNEENRGGYDALYQNWKAIYPRQLALCDEGLTRNMWIAPGL